MQIWHSARVDTPLHGYRLNYERRLRSEDATASHTPPTSRFGDTICIWMLSARVLNIKLC